MGFLNNLLDKISEKPSGAVNTSLISSDNEIGKRESQIESYKQQELKKKQEELDKQLHEIREEKAKDSNSVITTSNLSAEMSEFDTKVKKLQILKKQGILSDEEFEEERKKLMEQLI